MEITTKRWANSTNFTAIEYNVEKSCLFWYDQPSGKLQRQNISDDDTAEEIWRANPGTQIDMTYDYKKDVMYIVSEHKNNIEAISNASGVYEISDLPKFRKYSSRSIAVYPEKNYLFYLAVNAWKSIVGRVDLPGTVGITLIEFGTSKGPDVISIDHVDNRLYWIESGASLIASIDFDGNNRCTMELNFFQMRFPFVVDLGSLHLTETNIRTISQTEAHHKNHNSDTVLSKFVREKRIESMTLGVKSIDSKDSSLATAKQNKFKCNVEYNTHIAYVFTLNSLYILHK